MVFYVKICSNSIRFVLMMWWSQIQKTISFLSIHINFHLKAKWNGLSKARKWNWYTTFFSNTDTSLQVTYLGAFSCEVSWILEAHGDLPMYAYLLCSGYFIMFVASTILIHGLATGLSWGLFSWSIMVGILSIPELIFVMVMTTQFWVSLIRIDLE